MFHYRSRRTLVATFVAAFVLFAADESRIVSAQGPGGGSLRPPAEEDRRDDNGERGRRGGRRNGDRPVRPERDDSGDRGRRDARSDASPSPTPSAPTTAGFGTTGSDADRAAGLRKWAADLVKKHDKNGNMMLEADEQDGLSSSSRGADLNGDGVITIDELVAHLSPKSQPAAVSTGVGTQAIAERPASVRSDRGKSEGSQAKEIARTVKGKGKSHRFRSVKDRQSNWRFSSKDTNGDGQVSMREYSGTWNDRIAAEFQRHDRNNDGMITPDEVR